MSEWLEIDELPISEHGDPVRDVLVYGPSIGIHRGTVVRYESGYQYAGVAHINGNLLDDASITHWMPLPAPPKEQA